MERHVQGDPPVPFRVGPYALYMRIEDLPAIKEFSAEEYASLPKQFQDEQIFSAADCDFVGCDWQVTLGVRAGYVYKIFLDSKFQIPQQGDAAFYKMRMYWERTLGPPSEESLPRTTWDAPFGNVILVKRQIAGVSYVNLCLTSRDVTPRCDGDIRSLNRTARKVRSGDLLLDNLTASQLDRWVWLRAAEWMNFPSFVSQPVVPVLLVFIPWLYVLAGVLLLDFIWVLLRYRYIHLRLAVYAAQFVIFTKWPAAIGSAAFLFLHHSPIAGVLAIAWPVGLSGVVVVPGKIGRIESLFAQEIGIPRW